MTDKEIITCQKSQIEDLKEALEERIERIKELEAEVERLNHCVKTEDEVRAIMKSQMSSVVKEVTAEQFDLAMELSKIATIIEFAKRLTDKASVYRINDLDCGWQITEEELDTLVKEMTEDRQCLTEKNTSSVGHYLMP